MANVMVADCSGGIGRVYDEDGEVVEEWAASSDCIYDELGICQGCPVCKVRPDLEDDWEFEEMCESEELDVEQDDLPDGFYDAKEPEASDEEQQAGQDAPASELETAGETPVSPIESSGRGLYRRLRDAAIRLRVKAASGQFDPASNSLALAAFAALVGARIAVGTAFPGLAQSDPLDLLRAMPHMYVSLVSTMFTAALETYEDAFLAFAGLLS